MKKAYLTLFLFLLITTLYGKYENIPPMKCLENPDLVFNDGEVITLGLSWSGIKGAESVFSVEFSDDGTSFFIRNRTKTTPFFTKLHKVDNRITTTVSRKYFNTLHYGDIIIEGKNNTSTKSVFDYEKLKVFEKSTNFLTGKKKESETEIPNCIMDVMTAFYRMRQLEMKPGESQVLWLYADEKTYPVKINAICYEKVKTPLGKIKCIKVEPVMDYDAQGFFKKKGKLWIWISCDKRRIPVKIVSKVKLGSVKAKLLNYKPGTTPEPNEGEQYVGN